MAAAGHPGAAGSGDGDPGRRRVALQPARRLEPHRRAGPRSGDHRRRQRQAEALRRLRSACAGAPWRFRRAPSRRGRSCRVRDRPPASHRRSGAGREGARSGGGLFRRRGAAAPRRGALPGRRLTDPDGRRRRRGVRGGRCRRRGHPGVRRALHRTRCAGSTRERACSARAAPSGTRPDGARVAPRSARLHRGALCRDPGGHAPARDHARARHRRRHRRRGRGWAGGGRR